MAVVLLEVRTDNVEQNEILGIEIIHTYKTYCYEKTV